MWILDLSGIPDIGYQIDPSLLVGGRSDQNVSNEYTLLSFYSCIGLCKTTSQDVVLHTSQKDLKLTYRCMKIF